MYVAESTLRGSVGSSRVACVVSPARQRSARTARGTVSRVLPSGIRASMGWPGPWPTGEIRHAGAASAGPGVTTVRRPRCSTRGLDVCRLRAFRQPGGRRHLCGCRSAGPRSRVGVESAGTLPRGHVAGMLSRGHQRKEFCRPVMAEERTTCLLGAVDVSDGVHVLVLSRPGVVSGAGGRPPSGPGYGPVESVAPRMPRGGATPCCPSRHPGELRNITRRR